MKMTPEQRARWREVKAQGRAARDFMQTVIDATNARLAARELERRPGTQPGRGA